MKKVLLLGHPLGHSASPVFQNAGFKALGVDVTYELCDIPPEELESKIKEIRESAEYLGCNVTIPYKVDAKGLVDKIDDENTYVEDIGAINTIVNKNGVLRGYNTDVLGFFVGIEKKLNLDIRDKVIFIAGAGGAGRAIEMGSLFKGARKIVIAEPDRQKRLDIVSEMNSRAVSLNEKGEISSFDPFQDASDVDKEVKEADLIVNATPLGMGEDKRTSINTDVLHEGQYVFDLVYNPIETELLKKAREKGLKCCNGLVMLLYQGIEAFDLWMKEFTGEKPSEEIHKKMEDALKNHFGVAEL